MSGTRENRDKLKLRGHKVTSGTEANATYFWISKKSEIVKREYFPDFISENKFG